MRIKLVAALFVLLWAAHGVASTLDVSSSELSSDDFSWVSEHGAYEYESRWSMDESDDDDDDGDSDDSWSKHEDDDDDHHGEMWSMHDDDDDDDDDTDSDFPDFDDDDDDFHYPGMGDDDGVPAVPLPPSVWLFISGLFGLGLYRRKK